MTQASNAKKLDEIFERIGSFGPYQLLLLVIVGQTAMISCINSMSYIFISATPAHRCKLPGFEGDSFNVLNETHQSYVDQYIPIEIEKGDSSKRIYDKCRLKNSSVENDKNAFYHCNEWVYSTEHFGTTIATDWNMVCGNAVIKSTMASIFFFGNYYALVNGILSDKFGRKFMSYINFFLCTLFGFLICVVLNFDLGISLWTRQVLFTTFRLCVGIFGTFYTVTTALLLELTGPSKRVFAVSVNYYAYIVGEYVVLLVAYFVRDYRPLSVIYACIVGATLLIFWLVPESPRWLLTHKGSTQAKCKKRRREAIAVFNRIAKSNGKEPIPDDYFSDDESDEKQETKMLIDGEKKKASSENSIMQVLRIPKHFLIFCFITLNWVANALVYWGLSYNTNSLVGNPYLNYFLAATLELIAIVSSNFLFDRVGRKWPYTIGMFTMGVSLLIIMLIPKTSIVVTVLALVGKFAVSLTYNGIYLITGEYYPTTIRSSAISFFASMSRLGPVLAPYVQLLGDVYWYPIPFLVFGVSGLVAAVSWVALVPETKSRKMNDTIQEFLEND